MRALCVAVAGRVLVEALDCAIVPGEFVALLGGNGAGKSLLLRTLAGLRAPSAGQVFLEGIDLGSLSRRDIARRLGFLPQDPEAPPQGSVHETVLLGRFAHLGFWRAADDADLRRVDDSLACVGLVSAGGRDLGTLSGGEQRRAAIARLLAQAPSVYLLDEPTNHLDPAQQIGVLRTMRELSRAGAAVVASLHDPNLALRFADRVALMAGDGTVVLRAVADLSPPDLTKLYGLPYVETRLGAQRLMAPG